MTLSGVCFACATSVCFGGRAHCRQLATSLFDDSGESLIKVVAQNQQYLGVNRAIRAMKERRGRSGRLGVFWHTQGAGKSYSMVFFSRKVHRKLGGNFTFLVLCDRDDLDNQIYRTYAG